MQNTIKIDTSLIPPVEARNLAATFLKFIEVLSEDPEIMREFEEWKKREEHKKYQI